jgi:hypothetical protein
LIAAYCFALVGHLLLPPGISIDATFHIILACGYLAAANIYLLGKATAQLDNAFAKALKLQVQDYNQVPKECLYSSSSSTCAICLQDFAAVDAVIILPCQHIFHGACASQWLRRERRCPLRCNLASESNKIETNGAVTEGRRPLDACDGDAQPADLEVGELEEDAPPAIVEL